MRGDCGQEGGGRGRGYEVYLIQLLVDLVFAPTNGGTFALSDPLITFFFFLYPMKEI